MRILFTSLCTLLSLSFVVAQEELMVPSDSVEIIEQEHDFGLILQEDGDVSHQFQIVNNYGKAFAVLAVEPECGCTHSEEAGFSVEPADTGVINITYGASTHPDDFYKKIMVMTDKDTFQLAIKGHVKPDPKLEYYTVEKEGLLFEFGDVYFDNVKNNEVVSKSFRFYNPTEDTYMFDPTKNKMPEWFSLTFKETEVKAKGFSEFTVTYDVNKRPDTWGYQMDDVEFFTADGEKSFYFVARSTIEEYFDANRDVSLDPYIEMDSTVYAYGTLDYGDTLAHEYHFENTGKSDLIVRKMHSSCKCVKVRFQDDKLVYKPGEKGTIFLEFYAGRRTGTQRKTVFLQTNSPGKPVVLLKLDGKVREEE